MQQRKPIRVKQRGVMLLEALIAILIFSIGVLAIVGLQAAAVRNVGDTKYRANAGFLANQLIGQMWTEPAATLAAQFGTGGPKFTTWRNAFANEGTFLPNGNATVVVNASNVVTVTITWQAPSDPAPHSYSTTTHIQR